MTESDENDDHPLTQITVSVILGAGLIALFAGVDWFWAIWVVGFAVVLPIVGTLQRYYLDGSDDERVEASDDEDDALTTLRERYAAGEIDEATFERRVAKLLETEDEATAREFRGVTAEGSRGGARSHTGGSDRSHTSGSDRSHTGGSARSHTSGERSADDEREPEFDVE